MDAKERILKTINHEEADYVPSFEITIDNLSIYNHFRLKYGYQGNGDLLKKTYDLMKGDTKLLKKLIEKTSKVSDTLTPAIDLYRKMGIDLFPIYTTNFPVFYEREGFIDDFGLEKFSKFLTRPEILKEIFKNRGKFAVEMIKRFIEWGEDGIVLMGDDYGFKNGLLMHPKYYEEYIFPWIKKMCEIAHRAGIKFFLHTCGDVYNIFERILACGVDMIHPIEPTTANPEFDIFKLYQKYSDRVTFVGNVSPQDLADKKPKDIQSYVKKLIRELAPGGGYILSSGHSINPAIKLENFLKMHETLKKYGKYPIKID
ncbi:MAG: uroporphyrinogen decarboxylase family protein [Candidatus Lokiarchaeota archaeon]